MQKNLWYRIADLEQAIDRVLAERRSGPGRARVGSEALFASLSQDDRERLAQLLAQGVYENLKRMGHDDEAALAMTVAALGRLLGDRDDDFASMPPAGSA